MSSLDGKGFYSKHEGMKALLFLSFFGLVFQTHSKLDPIGPGKEMELRAKFTQATQAFTENYFKKCEGSGCKTCHPDQILLAFQTELNGVLAKNEFAFSPVPKSKTLAEKIRPQFESYAKAFCQLPSTVWKSRKVDLQCEFKMLQEVAHELRYFFRIPENEGDVCGQL